MLRAVEADGRRVSVLAVGTWLRANPLIAARIRSAGHDLGNHTMHHYPMRDLTAAVAAEEVLGCARELRRLTGGQGRWFRASGTQRTTPLIRRAAARAGYRTCVSYDVDGLDWLDPPVATVVEAVLSGARRGSIVSLHLGHSVTPRALPLVLSGLRERHLEPVTLTELLA